MSVPLALQLDAPSWRIKRLSRQTVIVGAVVILLIGSVGGWLLLRTISPAKTTLQAANSRDAEAFFSAPKSPSGAVVAASSFLEFYGTLISTSDASQINSLDQMLSELAPVTLRPTINKAIETGRKSWAASPTHAVRLTPLTYKSASYSSTTASVTVWSSLVLSVGIDSKVFWTTSNIDLGWSDGHWKIENWVVRPGPTPKNSSISSGENVDNAASLLETMNGFEIYRRLPAEDTPGGHQGENRT
jgi:hypothetical protein